MVGVPSIPIPFAGGYRMPRSIGSAAKTLRELKPDLIEVGDPYHFAWSALRVRRHCRVPVIGFYHSDLPRIIGQRFGQQAQLVATRYVSHLYRQFDLVLAPSQIMAKRLRELGVQQVRCQPLGVDTTVFDPARRDPALRKSLGLPDNTRLLVYAGRFTREKKLHLLIEAVEKLGAPYHLLMIGNNGEAISSPFVTCVPFQRDPVALARLMASCDVLVHPGDQETFGLVILEAMASGLPVVGVAAAGVGELVDRSFGVTVKPGCAQSLASGIAAVYKAEREELGANARNIAVTRYDWNAIFPQLFSHYASLISAPLRAELEAGVMYATE